MDWSDVSADEIERGFDHFGGLRSASEAELCSLIRAADAGQIWMGDGAQTLVGWVAARRRISSGTARRLVRMARTLADLPVLSARLAAGDLSLDQVDAISKMATPDTETALVEEALGLSNHQLDRMARRSDPPTSEDEAEARQLRALWIQRRLDDAGAGSLPSWPTPSSRSWKQAARACGTLSSEPGQRGVRPLFAEIGQRSG